MKFFLLQKCTSSFVLLFLIIGFSSCLTPRKVDRWIDAKYGSTIKSKDRSNNYISIKAASKSSDIVARTEKRKMKLLPLLFYWKWQYGTFTTLNEAIPDATIASTILPYANAKGLRQKLNGQKIELTITKVPTQFSVVDDGWLVFLVLYYINDDDISMQPQPQDLVVSYRILKDNVETKTGTITVADRNKPRHVKLFHSTKKTFWSYLDDYNNDIQAMSKEAVDKLITEVQTNTAVIN